MEQEGTQGTPQPPEEEEAGRERISDSPRFLEEIIRERIPGTSYFLEEVGGERIPGTPYLLEDITRESIPGTPQPLEEVSEERIPGIPQFLEEVGGERIPGTPRFLEEVSEESIPGTPQSLEEISRESIPGTFQLPEEGGGERIPATRQFLEEVSEESIPGTPQSLEEVRGERIPGIPQFLEEISRERIPATPQPLEEVGGERIPGIPQFLEEISGERIPGIPQFLEEFRGERIPGIPQFLEISSARIPDAVRESPAPSEEESREEPREESQEQEGVSSPKEPLGVSQVEQPLQERGTPLGTPQAVPGTSAEPPKSQPPTRDADFYCVKWIRWKGERTPVVTQSENGPCPLLAIINILLLQWKVKLPPQKEVITAEELMAHLGNCILATQPRDTSEGLQLNFQQNINDTMTVLPKLSTGLDVNVRFTGVSDFEYTPECIIFDLLNIPLYHGWLVDPQSPEQVQAVGKLSYNQLVEKIITCKQSNDSSLVSEGLVAEQFLEATASQLTFHGLCELTARAREGELGVFFRNNHFSTMIKHQGHLYLLVTDQGFLQEEEVVWESLQSVDGDSSFCDPEFRLSLAGSKEGASGVASEQQRQLDQDYMVALSLQQQGQELLPSVLSDLELARQLQHEEYQQQQQQPHLPHPPHHHHPQPLPAQAGRGPTGERRQRPKADLDCTLL